MNTNGSFKSLLPRVMVEIESLPFQSPQRITQELSYWSATSRDEHLEYFLLCYEKAKDMYLTELNQIDKGNDQVVSTKIPIIDFDFNNPLYQHMNQRIWTMFIRKGFDSERRGVFAHLLYQNGAQISDALMNGTVILNNALWAVNSYVIDVILGPYTNNIGNIPGIDMFYQQKGLDNDNGMTKETILTLNTTQSTLISTIPVIKTPNDKNITPTKYIINPFSTVPSTISRRLVTTPSLLLQSTQQSSSQTFQTTKWSESTQLLSLQSPSPPLFPPSPPPLPILSHIINPIQPQPRLDIQSFSHIFNEWNGAPSYKIISSLFNKNSTFFSTFLEYINLSKPKYQNDSINHNDMHDCDSDCDNDNQWMVKLGGFCKVKCVIPDIYLIKFLTEFDTFMQFISSSNNNNNNSNNNNNNMFTHTLLPYVQDMYNDTTQKINLVVTIPSFPILSPTHFTIKQLHRLIRLSFKRCGDDVQVVEWILKQTHQYLTRLMMLELIIYSITNMHFGAVCCLHAYCRLLPLGHIINGENDESGQSNNDDDDEEYDDYDTFGELYDDEDDEDDVNDVDNDSEHYNNNDNHDEQMVQFYLTNYQFIEQKTILHQFAHCYATELIDWLFIQDGVVDLVNIDANISSSKCHSPLAYAIQQGNVYLARKLLQYGAVLFPTLQLINIPSQYLGVVNNNTNNNNGDIDIDIDNNTDNISGNTAIDTIIHNIFETREMRRTRLELRKKLRLSTIKIMFELMGSMLLSNGILVDTNRYNYDHYLQCVSIEMLNIVFESLKIPLSSHYLISDTLLSQNTTNSPSNIKPDDIITNNTNTKDKQITSRYHYRQESIIDFAAYINISRPSTNQTVLDMTIITALVNMLYNEPQLLSYITNLIGFFGANPLYVYKPVVVVINNKENDNNNDDNNGNDQDNDKKYLLTKRKTPLPGRLPTVTLPQTGFHSITSLASGIFVRGTGVVYSQNDTTHTTKGVNTNNDSKSLQSNNSTIESTQLSTTQLSTKYPDDLCSKLLESIFLGLICCIENNASYRWLQIDTHKRTRRFIDRNC